MRARLAPIWLFCTLLLTACSQALDEPDQGIRVDQAMSGDDQGFSRALKPRLFSFPADHGPHAGFKHEWWYFTGNLRDEQGQRYGYQVTFFRIGLQADPPLRQSAWATSALWMAHVAVSDISGGRHLAHERFSRAAAGLAGAQANAESIWVRDWRIERDTQSGHWRIRIQAPDFELELDLEALRQPVLQGDAGLSQKSGAPGNASYYYSIPRLASQGQLRLDGQQIPVTGLSWLDREWSSSALGPDQIGWDWFSLQLDDGSDLMYYRLRLKDGATDRHSRGSIQLADGSHHDLTPENLHLTPLDWWQSPQGQRYPIAWRMDFSDTGRQLRVDAALQRQLMDLSVRYWEGAVEVREPGSRKIIGRGYLEMTGY